MFDRVSLKREAKGIVKNAKASAYLFTLLYLIIVSVLELINTYVSGSVVSYLAYYGVPVPEFLQRALTFPATLVIFVSVMVSLLSSVLYAGYTIYHLGVRRGQYMEYGTLFDGFSFVGKVIFLQIIQFIYIFLWSMLLVIPGIIAAYRYRFALYNLCENPEISPMQAMGMSSRQTYGHKLDLFILDLTFIGWQLLCDLTLGILSIWITPYIFQTDLGYFHQLKRVTGIGYFPPEENGGDFRSQDDF